MLICRDPAPALRPFVTTLHSRRRGQKTRQDAQLDFGGSTLMLADEFSEYNIKGPQGVGATTVSIHIHVDNADEVIRRAAAAGAEVVFEPKDQFYGERSGRIRDPFGHEWNIGHHIENVSHEEMQRRYTAMMKGK